MECRDDRDQRMRFSGWAKTRLSAFTVVAVKEFSIM
jgi:hypothetical protein